MNEKHILVFGANEEETSGFSSDFPNARATGRIDELSNILIDDHVDALIIGADVLPEMRLAIRNLMISHGLDIDIVEQERGEGLETALARHFE
jgi:hypothetical protein